MRWTRGVVVASGLLALSGCVYGYSNIGVARYSAETRPDPSYFCYDCHGYRYFDPYYDYCAGEGFRYRWASHPQVITLYRERYVRIRENHPDYGRYRYTPRYRSSSRYREGRDYEAWRARERDEAGAFEERRELRKRSGDERRSKDEAKGKTRGKKSKSDGDKRPSDKRSQRFDRGGVRQ